MSNSCRCGQRPKLRGIELVCGVFEDGEEGKSVQWQQAEWHTGQQGKLGSVFQVKGHGRLNLEGRHRG